MTAVSTDTPASTDTHWNELNTDYDVVLATDPSNRALLAGVLDLLPRDAQSLLDLGSGTGRLTAMCREVLPEAEFVGLDPAPNMVADARVKFAGDPKTRFVEGVAEDLSQFADESFDVIISSFALHHLSHDDKRVSAAEAFRVLKPGGRFINADQYCRVMGEPGDRDRVLDVFELLTAKARYYLLHASLERMLLQLDLLPLFIREDGEILATAEFWVEALSDAGFADPRIVATEPVELFNRVVWATKPGQ
ncbi:methyltransferase domain-containing protein [Planotetraspora sp. A-T 1434]|uniref:class I SAM-dependent methyltransferase n=1 Tax=Planotetraspora sp. A-T 1434 TaxID=2979219 RepID=UPI0021BEF5C8|nr:class I SAM-dependent methyltransferase [Planotetraspora sp. A-T 1434]MCT9933576.1 methyltransferase domain-containing protein [Planotetraspora sp. A-T 1434]